MQLYIYCCRHYRKETPDKSLHYHYTLLRDRRFGEIVKLSKLTFSHSASSFGTGEENIRHFKPNFVFLETQTDF